MSSLRWKDEQNSVSRLVLMLVPTTPRPLDTDGLKQTIQAFQRLRVTHYKVLITSMPPPNEPESAELSELLHELKVLLFGTGIPA